MISNCAGYFESIFGWREWKCLHSDHVELNLYFALTLGHFLFLLGSKYRSASRPGTSGKYAAAVATSPTNVDETELKTEGFQLQIANHTKS